MEEIQAIAALVSDLGTIGILLYLLVQERVERQAARKAHIDDLREVADLKHSLSRTPALSPARELSGS